MRRPPGCGRTATRGAPRTAAGRAGGSVSARQSRRWPPRTACSPTPGVPGHTSRRTGSRPCTVSVRRKGGGEMFGSGLYFWSLVVMFFNAATCDELSRKSW